MTLGEALALGPGSVVTLDRMADQPVDLLVNGKRIARGEVVVVDEEFGLRVTTEPGPSASASPRVIRVRPISTVSSTEIAVRRSRSAS
jgi:flagellar motor switch protein FliN/FliY